MMLKRGLPHERVVGRAGYELNLLFFPGLLHTQTSFENYSLYEAFRSQKIGLHSGLSRQL